MTDKMYDAGVTQVLLVFDTREYLHTPSEVVTGPDLSDVTHRYKSNARIP